MARTQMPVSPSAHTQPRWCGDFISDHIRPGGAILNAAEFPKSSAVTVTVGTGGAAIGATTVPVTALPGYLPAGAVLDFGGGKIVRTTAPAAATATAITTEPLTVAVVAADAATYAGTGLRTVVSGTAIGRTLAERDAATGYGPADAADDEIWIVPFEVPDADANPDVELLRAGTLVFENFLPGFAGLASGIVTKLRAKYDVTLGAE